MTIKTMQNENKKRKRMFVIKRSGDKEPVYFDKITVRNEQLSEDLNIDPQEVSKRVIEGLYSGIKTEDLDKLSAETALYMSTHNPEYEVLAKRIIISDLHKKTKRSFSEVTGEMYELGLLAEDYNDFVQKNAKELDSIPNFDRDYDFTYFGFKTLEKSYLNKNIKGEIIERPQHLWLRVATFLRMPDMKKIKEVYEMLSLKYFTHATPTLFHAGFRYAQLSSCFLLSMDDDLHSMYECLKNGAMISKFSGGIGINISMLRPKGSRISSTGGKSDGIVPFLKVWNSTARHVNQGGGKRKGSVAVYMEPWHPDVFEFLNTRKNNTKEEDQCLDIHIGLWVPDLFMKRLEQDGDWCLFDPNKVKGLYDNYGEEFERIYLQAEKNGLYDKKIKIRELWKEILIAQMETGEPYILYKDHVNRKSNQKNRGVIRGSNLCVSKDTMILCKDGYHKISDKVNTEVEVWNGKEFSKTEVKKTGVDQEMLTVEFTNGVKICCTPYHKFYIEESKRPAETSNVKMYEAKDLKIDMKLPRNELGVCDENDKKMKYAYTHGLFCADGTYESHDTEEKRCGFKKFEDTQFCKRHQDSIMKHDDGDEICRANSYAIKPKITLYGEKQNLLKYMDYRYSNESEKTITAVLEYDLEKKFVVPINYSTETKIRWLEGLVDGDGCLVNNNGSYGIQISSIHKEFLTDVFYMLQTLGIESTIHLMRKAGKTLLPDGKGGKKHYVTKDCYRLCIKNDNIITLKKHGFSPKRVIIPDIEYSKYNMWRYTKIKSISVNDTNEDTYCFNEPKEHKGIFNGVLLGNCAEIVEYTDDDNIAVCNLCSISLPAFVNLENKTYDYEKLGEITRTLVENMNIVIDKNYYPVEKARKSNMEMRPTGIGVQGLADVFQLLGLSWKDEKAKEINKKISAVIYYNSVKSSMEIAKRDGPYEYFEGSPMSRGVLQPDMWGIEPDTVDGLLDWDSLREDVKKHGVRNSLLTAQMPTASTAQILGNNESIEPYTSNMYSRQVLSGNFPVINKHLFKTMSEKRLWNKENVDQIIRDNGSIQNISGIDTKTKEIFKTSWELSMKTMVEYSADRGAYICQTQSFNCFMAEPTMKKLSSLAMFGWKKGLKTSNYYVRRKTKAEAIKFTLMEEKPTKKMECNDEEGCLMCSG